MFTQSAPAIINALSGVLPDTAVRALVQALGNCQQPLSHRGDVTLQPTIRQGRNGLAQMGTWNPQQYPELLPPNFNQHFYDLPNVGSYTNGDWYSANYAGAQFSFPTSQEFSLNSYYGGPTFNVGGNSTFNNTFTNNAYAVNADFSTTSIENLTVNNFNGVPASPLGTPAPVGGVILYESYVGGPEYNFFAGAYNTFGAQGRPATAATLANVDVYGYVDIPVITKAWIAEDCTVQFEQDVTPLPLRITVLPVLSPLRYLEPVR